MSQIKQACGLQPEDRRDSVLAVRFSKRDTEMLVALKQRYGARSASDLIRKVINEAYIGLELEEKAS